MKLLILIPARKGSKRIPRKNSKKLLTKPLINYTLEICKNFLNNNKVIISTDDRKIKEIAHPFAFANVLLRPKILAGDSVTTVDVALYILRKIKKDGYQPDGIMLLQPTSPFRTTSLVKKGISMFKKSKGKPIVAFSKASTHPWLTFKFIRKQFKPFFSIKRFEVKNLYKPIAYAPNGAFYLISPKDLEKYRSFYPKHLIPLFVNSKKEALDIDTSDDWKVAEMYLKSKQ